MRAMPSSGRLWRRRCAGVSTTVTSRVGRAMPLRKWPPRVVPSLRPSTACMCRLGLPSSPVAMSPKKAQSFALAVDLDRLVGLPGEIEPADRRALEGAQRRQRRGGKVGARGEAHDGGEGLLAGVEDEDEGAFAGIFPDELGLHRGLLSCVRQG